MSFHSSESDRVRQLTDNKPPAGLFGGRKAADVVVGLLRNFREAVLEIGENGTQAVVSGGEQHALHLLFQSTVALVSMYHHIASAVAYFNVFR